MQERSTTHRSTFTAKAGKQLLYRFLYLTVILGVLIALFTITIDPLQFYRKATLYTPIFSTEQRYQNPGLALNSIYDTIIIGTSMTENFLPSEVDKAIGGRTLKLSMRGSTSDEQYKITALALQTGKVKNVVWGLDYFALKTNVQTDSSAFPNYLYDNNKLNDFHYWFNYSVYEQFAIGITKKLIGKAPASLEYLYNWNSKVKFGEENVLEAYEEARFTENNFELNEEPLSVVKQNFILSVLSLVKKYPEVTFHFYYPPYSILRHRVWKDTNPTRFNNQLMMKSWIFHQFEPYANVLLYDFQTKSEWTYNLDLYTDLSHHNQNVNTWIAQAIGRRDKESLVTKQNVESFRDKLSKQVNSVLITEGHKVKNIEVVILNEQSELLTFSSILMPGEDELLVPAKELAAAIGASMQWNQATKQITLEHGGNLIMMTIGDAGMIVNGNQVDIPHPARIKGNTALIPLHLTSEELGYKVKLVNTDANTTQFMIE